jgi:hypothetical protein
MMGKSEEYDMVNDIMSMVFNSIDETEEPEELKFRDYFEKRRASYGDKVGFGEARNIIFDYSRISKIEIPKVFTGVLSIYEEEKIGEQGRD